MNNHHAPSQKTPKWKRQAAFHAHYERIEKVPCEAPNTTLQDSLCDALLQHVRPVYGTGALGRKDTYGLRVSAQTHTTLLYGQRRAAVTTTDIADHSDGQFRWITYRAGKHSGSKSQREVNAYLVCKESQSVIRFLLQIVCPWSCADKLRGSQSWWTKIEKRQGCPQPYLGR